LYCIEMQSRLNDRVLRLTITMFTYPHIHDISHNLTTGNSFRLFNRLVCEWRQ